MNIMEKLWGRGGKHAQGFVQYLVSLEVKITKRTEHNDTWQLVFPAFQTLRQEDQEFESSLGQINSKTVPNKTKDISRSMGSHC